MKSNPGSLTCTRRIEFDAAHRVVNHESKCRHVHGHRYALEATFSARSLDRLGRIIDFGVIKERLGQWIDEHWDHTAILFDQDKELGSAMADITGQRIFYLPANPTAENMADYLMSEVCPALFGDLPIECVRLRLYETPNCYAESLSGQA
ncbi:MAG: 6-carboxytetrahydropterin synthase [Pseudomonadota bacterium]|nr:6-carboxytetrahydropterin synthase [Pseudomonadota bacterium]